MGYPETTGRVITSSTGAYNICRLSSPFLGEKNGFGVPPGVYYISGSWIAKTIVDVGGTPTLYTAAGSFRAVHFFYNGWMEALPFEEAPPISNYPTSPSNIMPAVAILSNSEGLELWVYPNTSDETEVLGTMKLELKLAVPEV